MKNLTATKIYALAFGLFLGLCIWKFGNPVILDNKIPTPVSASDFLNDPWPTNSSGGTGGWGGHAGWSEGINRIGHTGLRDREQSRADLNGADALLPA